MCELDKIHSHSIVHYWDKADWASCKSYKLCWYYNNRNLRGSSLRSEVSEGRIECLLMQLVEVSYVRSGQEPVK